MKLLNLSVNERRLIEIITAGKPVARVDLARRSGMTGAAVTRLVARLSHLELLTEKADRAGAQGQPRRLLSLRTDRFLSAGITFTAFFMKIVVVNLAGKTRASRLVDIKTSNAKSIAQAAKLAVEAMLTEIGASKRHLLGIGCAVPANFAAMSQMAKVSPIFVALDSGEAENAFQTIFEAPVAFESNGTAAALGEYVFSKRGNRPDPMYLIHIGDDVEGGFVINGRPYRGANGNACQPGVLYSIDGPRPSGEDLLGCLGKAGYRIADFAELGNMPEEAQSVAAAWTERAGRQLRQTVRMVTAMFDPALIIVGGKLPDDITRGLVAAITNKSVPGSSIGVGDAPIEVSCLGARGEAVGAAATAFFDALFSGAVADNASPYLNGRRSKSTNDASNGR